MRIEEFDQRFYRTGVPQLDMDMIPILVTEEGVYSPPIPFGSTDAYSPISQGEAGREEIEERCIEFESKDSAIAYWVDRGYKVFVLYERRPV